MRRGGVRRAECRRWRRRGRPRGATRAAHHDERRPAAAASRTGAASRGSGMSDVIRAGCSIGGSSGTSARRPISSNPHQNVSRLCDPLTAPGYRRLRYSPPKIKMREIHS